LRATALGFHCFVQRWPKGRLYPNIVRTGKLTPKPPLPYVLLFTESPSRSFCGGLFTTVSDPVRPLLTMTCPCRSAPVVTESRCTLLSSIWKTTGLPSRVVTASFGMVTMRCGGESFFSATFWGCRKVTLQLISGFRFLSLSRMETFTVTVALVRSAVGMTWRRTPLYVWLGIACT